MEHYEELAVAVVKQACEDYRHYSKALQSEYLDDYQKKDIEAKIKEIVLFFNSEYGDLLCFGKAKVILEKLEKEFC